MPTFPEPPDALTTAAVALRLAAERDIPEVLIAHQDDPELYRRLGLSRPPSGAELGRRVERGPSDRATGTAVWFTIVLAGASECIGQIDVHDVDWDHSRAELGIWTAPAHRGRGVAADALRLAGRWLLDECGLTRVQLLTDPSNVAMVATARRAGFAEEGVLRGYLRERGQRVDITMLSLVAGDLVASA
ncbi:MAG TPA: GNAT family protein [Solirubrobacteraceae bacterium]|jgi:RimJ/RimL family protein N-acetyltransferase|nr:GNAT family protein [Solirubrobacteraceae bacterium]